MILQDPVRPEQIRSALSELVSDSTVVRLRIAVAYANVGGVQVLKDLLSVAERSVEVEVIVSLDMGITRKGALERLLRDFGEGARVVSGAGSPGTFHAKVFIVDRTGAPLRALVGSANLTSAALTENREAGTVGDLNPEESAAWEEWWAELVANSDILTQEIIDDYVEKRPPPGKRERIADEDLETRDDGSTFRRGPAEISAEDASWLILDWGGTGEYRVQLEPPKAPAAFFRPEVQHERTITITFEGQEYANNLLRYYADNGMTRVNLDGEIPVVADESILGKTSLFVRLGPDHYELLLPGEEQRAKRLEEADAAGTRDHTTRTDGSHREFGWT